MHHNVGDGIKANAIHLMSIVFPGQARKDKFLFSQAKDEANDERHLQRMDCLAKNGAVATSKP